MIFNVVAQHVTRGRAERFSDVHKSSVTCMRVSPRAGARGPQVLTEKKVADFGLTHKAKEDWDKSVYL